MGRGQCGLAYNPANLLAFRAEMARRYWHKEAH
jgi:hypothetical protein